MHRRSLYGPIYFDGENEGGGGTPAPAEPQPLEAQLGQEPELPDAPPATPAEQQAMDPRIQELLDEREEQQAQMAYDAELARIGLPDQEQELFHPFVISAEGDFDRAHE